MQARPDKLREHRSTLSRLLPQVCETTWSASSLQWSGTAATPRLRVIGRRCPFRAEVDEDGFIGTAKTRWRFSRSLGLVEGGRGVLSGDGFSLRARSWSRSDQPRLGKISTTPLSMVGGDGPAVLDFVGDWSAFRS